jgi:hypothetical protein
MGMDRISGLLPQTGWSPLLSPATPKTAPASTVEPAAKSADTGGGQSAGTDTQTAQDHAQTARLFGGIAATYGESEPAQREPVGPPPDPNAVAGPMPTFEVSPLEQAAARVLAHPSGLEDTDAAQPDAPEPDETADKANETSLQDRRLTSDTSSQSAPPDTGAAQQWLAPPWPQTPQSGVSQLDVKR